MMMRTWRSGAVALAMMAAALAAPAAATAQVRTVDPNSAIDADLAPRPPQATPPRTPAPDSYQPVDAGPQDLPPPSAQDSVAQGAPATPAAPPAGSGAAQFGEAQARRDTYQRDDLIAAAEGVFGKGAAGIAGMIEKLLAEQGEPNAYITGREAAAAFGVGVRYGSGELTHRIEGKRNVYWTGPSLGFDVGGDAAKTFVLVYNLYDTQDIYKRFPAVEGRAYLVGGLAATYLRRGNIVLIPVRLGVGWRLGANVGYMKFSEKARWLPF